ncbi:hypothetical protein Fcan01_14450 [Folsomia candida]|uniref:Uncharacterized protein n=1 Tax=Folsomia candida TaxID=158441 RepID=A0A226E268_FOLCA|nr:hypothetical protein Fcan01_14450 [Folsomia candida]
MEKNCLLRTILLVQLTTTVLCQPPPADPQQKNVKLQNLLTRLFQATYQNTDLRPPNFADPTNVEVYLRSVKFESFDELSASRQVKFSADFITEYTDPRRMLNEPVAGPSTLGDIKYLEVPSWPETMFIWVPDLQFINADVTLRNNTIFRKPSGPCIGCPGWDNGYGSHVLQKTYTIQIASQKLSTEDLVLNWKLKNPIQPSEQKIQGFCIGAANKMTAIKYAAVASVGTCEKSEDDGVNFGNRNFSCLELEIKFVPADGPVQTC